MFWIYHTIEYYHYTINAYHNETSKNQFDRIWIIFMSIGVPANWARQNYVGKCIYERTLIRKPQFLFVWWWLGCYIVSIVINCQSRLFMSCLVCFQLATTLIVHWIQYVQLANHPLIKHILVLIGLSHLHLTILYHYFVCVVVDSFHSTYIYVMYKLTRFTIPSFTNSCVLACWIKNVI